MRLGRSIQFAWVAVRRVSGLVVLLSSGLVMRVPSVWAQAEAPPPRALAAHEVARRLGPVFGVDPAGVAVQARPIEYIRMRALEASLPQHDPPLYVLVEATSGEILYVKYKWPGAGGSGLFPVLEGGPRTPALDQEAAERVAGAAIEQCLGGVPKGYELVEATYNDMHLYLRYVFRWQEVAEGVRLPHRIRATVDGVKGRVASLSRLVYPVTVPLRPRVTRETAIQTALEHCRPLLQTGETLATPEAILQVDFAHSTKHPDRQFLMWSMKVFTAGPAPRPVLGVEVDAISGDVVGELLPGGGPAPAAEAGQQAGAPSAARVWADARVWAVAFPLLVLLAGASVLLARRSTRRGAAHRT